MFPGCGIFTSTLLPAHLGSTSPKELAHHPLPPGSLPGLILSCIAWHHFACSGREGGETETQLGVNSQSSHEPPHHRSEHAHCRRPRLSSISCSDGPSLFGNGCQREFADETHTHPHTYHSIIPSCFLPGTDVFKMKSSGCLLMLTHLTLPLEQGSPVVK